MKIRDSIIFDLDGTLWDASFATAAGWNAVLRENGFTNLEVTAEDIRRVSGLPPEESITKCFENASNFDQQALIPELDVAEKTNIEQSGGRLFADVYKGIADLSKVFDLFLVSNCQSWYLESFWTHTNLQSFFAGDVCNGKSRLPKSQMIKNISDTYYLKYPVYIGDTIWDQQAANMAGVEFGYVSYGFGEAVNPELEFDSFGELVGWFLSAKTA